MDSQPTAGNRNHTGAHRSLLLGLILGLVACASAHAAQYAPPVITDGNEVPGLAANGIGDDRTLAYYYALETFEGIDDSFFDQEYFFSAYTGNDANPGTRAAPFQTMNRYFQVCTELATRCTLLSHAGRSGVWSANQLNVPSFHGSQFRAGDSVSWGSAPAACPAPAMGVVIDSDPALGILSVRRNDENEVPPAASDEICSGDTKLAIASATNTAVPTHVPFTAACGYTHQPCWLGQGESVDRPAIIDMDFNETIGTSDALFMARDPDPNNGGGHLALQNIICQYAMDDCFSNTEANFEGGVIVLLNVVGISWNVRGVRENNNCVTTHGSGWAVVLGDRTWCRSHGDTLSNTGSALAPTGTGGVTWIGRGSITSSPRFPDSRSPPLSNTGGDLFLVGPYLHIDRANNGGTIVNLSGVHPFENDQPFEYYFIRTAIEGNLHQFNRSSVIFELDRNYTDGVELKMFFYESTISGEDCITIQSTQGARFRLVGRGLVLDECTDNALQIEAEATMAQIDLEGVADPEDTGFLCHSMVVPSGGGTRRDSYAACEAQLRSDYGDPNARFFTQNSFDSGGPAINGIQWSRSGFAEAHDIELGTPGFVATTPPAVHCASCDFVASGFQPGMKVHIDGVTGSTPPFINATVFPISAVSPTSLTFEQDEWVSGGDDGMSGARFREWTLPELAIHPEAEGHGRAIAPYAVTIPNRVPGGTLPAWTNRSQREVVGFQLQGKVGR